MEAGLFNSKRIKDEIKQQRNRPSLNTKWSEKTQSDKAALETEKKEVVIVHDIQNNWNFYKPGTLQIIHAV